MQRGAEERQCCVLDDLTLHWVGLLVTPPALLQTYLGATVVSCIFQANMPQIKLETKAVAILP